MDEHTVQIRGISDINRIGYTLEFSGGVNNSRDTEIIEDFVNPLDNKQAKGTVGSGEDVWIGDGDITIKNRAIAGGLDLEVIIDGLRMFVAPQEQVVWDESTQTASRFTLDVGEEFFDAGNALKLELLSVDSPAPNEINLSYIVSNRSDRSISANVVTGLKDKDGNPISGSGKRFTHLTILGNGDVTNSVIYTLDLGEDVTEEFAACAIVETATFKQGD